MSVIKTSNNTNKNVFRVFDKHVLSTNRFALMYASYVPSTILRIRTDYYSKHARGPVTVTAVNSVDSIYVCLYVCMYTVCMYVYSMYDVASIYEFPLPYVT